MSWATRGMGRHREGEGQSGPGWEAGPRGREDGPPGLGCGEGKWAMEKKGAAGWAGLLGWVWLWVGLGSLSFSISIFLFQTLLKSN